MSNIKPAFTLGLLVAGCLHFSSLQAAVLTGVDPTIFNVGSGHDISYLVIDESTLYSTPLEFVYHYTYDSNNPLTGYSLLTNIAANSSLSVNTTFYGGGLGNSLSSLSYQGGATVTGTNAPDYSVGTYWSYYNAGGSEVGYAAPTLTNWNYANVGMDSRYLAPGSWDGWTLASYGAGGIDTPPSVAIAAIPEPSIVSFMLLSLVALLPIARWTPFTRKPRD